MYNIKMNLSNVGCIPRYEAVLKMTVFTSFLGITVPFCSVYLNDDHPYPFSIPSHLKAKKT